MAQAITIIWSPKSLDLIADLRDFLIEKTDQLTADNYIDNLFDFADEKLNSNPERHPLCRNSTLQNAGCRRIIYKKKYLIVFEIPNASEVHVLGVIHYKRGKKEFEGLIE